MKGLRGGGRGEGFCNRLDTNGNSHARRHQLRPDTFPFLAVLLSTMGSLILVLMVFDRKARLAACARAEAAWRQDEQADAEKAARLLVEEQRRRQERQREQLARLSAEERRLNADHDRVRNRLADVLRSLEAAEREGFGAKKKQAADKTARAPSGFPRPSGRTHQGGPRSRGTAFRTPAADGGVTRPGGGTAAAARAAPARTADVVGGTLHWPPRPKRPPSLCRMHRRRPDLPPGSPDHALPGTDAGDHRHRGETPHGATRAAPRSPTGCCWYAPTASPITTSSFPPSSRWSWPTATSSSMRTGYSTSPIPQRPLCLRLPWRT